MERIQAALAKARAQHQSGSTTRTQHPARAIQTSSSTADAWSALTPCKLNRAQLKSHRIAAAERGQDAAPYDLLRTKIIHQAQTNGWRRVAIVSPDIGAGKTTTLANLAFSFERQQDLRVLCMDLDLRRPSLGRVLGQSTNHSMSDVLERRVRFSEHGLRLGERVGFGLNNGPASNPSEILLSHMARDTLQEIEQEYVPDLVFFDLSPLSASDDNIAFLQNVDCAVIVAAAESTSMKRIDKAEQQVAELTNVMGIVLNKCRYADGPDGHDYY
jgi:protein-tyrosine kinase